MDLVCIHLELFSRPVGGPAGSRAAGDPVAARTFPNRSQLTCRQSWPRGRILDKDAYLRFSRSVASDLLQSQCRQAKLRGGARTTPT